MYTVLRINNKEVKIILEDLYIPLDEGNRDYLEYLKWLDEGNTPEYIDVTEE